MFVRGIRGATVVPRDDPASILSATQELLIAIMEKNPTLKQADIASVFFTASEGLVSEYPARAAREIGWSQVPLLSSLEIPVPGSIDRCIRVLIHWNTDLPQSEIIHVYLHEAVSLRPDLSAGSKKELST